MSTTPYGLQSSGFVVKPLEDIKSDLEAAFQGAFGSGINLTESSYFGQIIGIGADRLSSLWDLAEALYLAFTPDGATGTALDDLAALTGDVRKPPEHTTLTETLTGTPGTLVPTGTVLQVTPNGPKFQTTADATLAAAAAWATGATGASYSQGQRVTNNGNVYQCVTAGQGAPNSAWIPSHLYSTPGTLVVNNGNLYKSVGIGTSASANPWSATTHYNVGDEVTNSGHTYVCTVAGAAAAPGPSGTGPGTTTDGGNVVWQYVSAAGPIGTGSSIQDGSGGLTWQYISPAGGPSGTGSAIQDNAAVWEYLGQGTALADVSCESQDLGNVVANIGTLTTIVTPVSGLQGAVNLLNALPGSGEQSDNDFRTQREAELASAGSGTTDAIQAAVTAVVGVTKVTVFENDSDMTDVNGVPPHSFETLVDQDGTQNPTVLANAIAQAIWDNKPAGIEPWGNGHSGTATDAEGTAHTVPFSYAQQIPIYVIITVTKDTNWDAVNTPVAIQNAIVAYIASLPDGTDVVSSRVIAAAIAVSGVFDVSSALIGSSSSPTTSTPVVIQSRQRANPQDTHVTVNAS